MTVLNSPPLVTVIIPVRNEARFIAQCLRSVFSADPVSGGMEVFVVDGMSDDGTREILAEWCRKHANLRVFDNPRRIVPTAMNIGIRAARGKWIIRLDAHSEYPANYFTLCLETSEKTDADNVGGDFLTLSRDQGFQGNLVQALTTHRFGVGNAGFRIAAPEGWSDTVVYGCYKREVFERIGLYDERLVRNQDYELNRRLLKAGGSIWRNPAIQVRYYNQGSLKGLLQQSWVTGQWNPWMWYIAPYSFAWRHAVPLAFVGSLLAAFLLSLVSPQVGIAAFALILVPYFILAFFSSLQQSSHHGGWMLPLLPFLFLIYHLSYGLGGLWGICRLLVKRTPVQLVSEPWPGAGSYRAWPMRTEKVAN
jgi:cellulose synthase/poly-beta-1,6-N-acetylglucosamine synthase-like glycosyltransferase